LRITLCFLIPVVALAQEKASTQPGGGKKARVFVTDSDSWQSQSTSGGGIAGLAAGFGSVSSAGARPQTAEIIKTIGERCPNLIVNNRPDLSDYIVRLDHEGGKGMFSHKNKVAVFVRKSGDSIYSTSTVTLGGSVQGACGAIDANWTANAASLGEAPAAAASTPAAMASLTVESSVAGAEIAIDGEFVGNAPSTLSVTAGKHTVTVKKAGYADWSRTMSVSGNAVRLSAELEAKP
jgi:hypothetical protein